MTSTEEKWGVWCVQDRAFCQDSVGTKEFAEAELPRWQSGVAAEVDPKLVTYEVRQFKNWTTSL